MEPFIGGLVGLAGILAQSGWQGAALANDIMNQRRQNRLADKQIRVATAGRTDAFGNKTAFDDLSNEWELELTPTQQQIVKAMEKEQLLNLTEDAERNRNIRRRQAERGNEAAQDYVRTKAEYDFTKPPSELSIRDEMTRLLADATNSRVNNETALGVRQALRTGQKGDISDMFKAGESKKAATMGENMLNARNLALAEKGTRDAAFENKLRPRLAELVQLMDMGGNTDIKFSDLPQQKSAEMADATKLIVSAISSAAGNINQANSMTSKTLNSGGPDSSLISSIIAAITKQQQPGRTIVQAQTGNSPFKFGQNLQGAF
jgi:hypothetical protein